jgi:hypothetical protein
MHEATWWRRLWVSIAVSTITTAGVGCGGSGQESATARVEHRIEQRSEVSAHGAEKLQKRAIARAVLTSPAVFVGQGLGMTLTGPGESGRSLAGLERDIQTFLPQLQAVYADELQQEPSLMGSLEIQLTIESNGTISDIRFSHMRLSGQRFKSAIFDHMRGWVFSQADKQVRLRSRLLFVPAGIDYTAILTWESYLNGQAGPVERGEPLRIVTAPVPVIHASPSVPSVEGKETPTPSMVAAAPKLPRAPAIPELHGGLARDESTREEPAFDPYAQAGWYRVTQKTVLYRAPHDSSGVIARLHQGMRIQAVATIRERGSGREWLEIHSVTDRPPGFVRRQYVKREVQQHAGPNESDQSDIL